MINPQLENPLETPPVPPLLQKSLVLGLQQAGGKFGPVLGVCMVKPCSLINVTMQQMRKTLADLKEPGLLAQTDMLATT